METLRVVIDGRSLLGYRTGTGQYTSHLIEALNSLDERPELHVFLGTRWEDTSCLQQTSMGSWRAARILTALTERAGNRIATFRKLLVHGIHRRFFARGLSRIRPDIVHGTASYIYPSEFPTVVTIHDISCFRYPETHLTSRVALERRHMPEMLRRARIIFAVSEFTKKELCDYFSVAADKIVVTHNGVDTRFYPRPPEAVSSFLARYRLNPGYLLYVGTLEPRKNLETLLNAYMLLPTRFRQKHPLVLAGMRGWKESRLLRLLDPLIRQGIVTMLGYVPQNELPLLFSGAKAFLYPSLYEGFGIPPLEAMASGVPVIASNISALPEVVGNAGILLDPKDTDAWSRAIREVVLDQSLRAMLGNKGKTRAKQFTWRKCAENTLDAYMRVAAR